MPASDRSRRCRDSIQLAVSNSGQRLLQILHWRRPLTYRRNASTSALSRSVVCFCQPNRSFCRAVLPRTSSHSPRRPEHSVQNCGGDGGRHSSKDRNRGIGKPLREDHVGRRSGKAIVSGPFSSIWNSACDKSGEIRIGHFQRTASIFSWISHSPSSLNASSSWMISCSVSARGCRIKVGAIKSLHRSLDSSGVCRAPHPRRLRPASRRCAAAPPRSRPPGR